MSMEVFQHHVMWRNSPTSIGKRMSCLNSDVEIIFSVFYGSIHDVARSLSGQSEKVEAVFANKIFLNLKTVFGVMTELSVQYGD